MTDKIFIVTDGDDGYKDLFNNLNDYVNNSHHLNSEDESFPRYRTNQSSFFNVSMGCDHQGISNGMYLIDTRTHFCSSNIDSENPMTPLSFKDEDYFYVDLAPNFLVQYLDKHGSVYFMETKADNFEEYDNALKNFELVYLSKDKFYNAKTQEQINIQEVNCMLAAFKLGSLPVYVVILNNMYLRSMAADEFEMPLIDAIGYTIRQTNDSFKDELFSLTFLEGADNRTGNYMIHTSQDKVVFELFSNHVDTWGYNGRQVAHKSFLYDLNKLVVLKDYITVNSSLPVTVTKTGKITINTSKMIENEMGYVSVSVDFGDYFNSVNALTQRPYFEFAVVKTSPSVESTIDFARVIS